jgi:hypothetical protein
MLLLFGAALCTASLAVATPARAESAKLFVVSPLPIVLGEVETISLVIEAPETPETEGRPIQVAVNVGKIDPPERVGQGKYRAIYRLPSTKYPQSAIVAVWRETGPDAEVDFLRIPLSARTKLPFKAKPGADVRVFIGDERFGPVSADRKGQAIIPIVVPPGVREVDVETSAALDKKKTSVVVKVPPFNRLAMAVTPYLLSPAAGAYALAHVYYDGDAAPAPNKIKLSVTGGEAVFQSVKGSRYTFKVTAKKGAEKELKLSAGVEGDPVANAQSTLMIGVPVPEKIITRSPPTSLVANGTATKVVRVLVIDHYGLGIPGLTLTAIASDGKVDGVKDVGRGNYETTLTAPASLPRKKKSVVTFSAVAPNGAPVTLEVETPIQNASGGQSSAAPEEITSVETPAPVRTDKQSMLTIAAKVGGTFDAQIAPMGALEVAIHPRAVEGRLSLLVSVAFRSMSKEFELEGVQGLKSSVTRLPVTAGITYDFLSRGSGRGYAGVAGGVAGIQHRVEANFQDPIIYRRIVPTLELLLGAQYAGVFLEVAGIYMSVSDDALSVPSLGVSAALGYRLGLF